ncbi:MAG: hypothetical protein IJM62_04645 [Lachnospiraceae bacterium]|nr:hypothetical protein [Lachnospiraceae bacterium]
MKRGKINILLSLLAILMLLTASCGKKAEDKGSEAPESDSGIETGSETEADHGEETEAASGSALRPGTSPTAISSP